MFNKNDDDYNNNYNTSFFLGGGGGGGGGGGVIHLRGYFGDDNSQCSHWTMIASQIEFFLRRYHQRSGLVNFDMITPAVVDLL